VSLGCLIIAENQEELRTFSTVSCFFARRLDGLENQEQSGDRTTLTYSPRVRLSHGLAKISLAVGILASGCKDRPWVLDPDGAVLVGGDTADHSVPVDLAIPDKPCHLLSSGPPATTLTYTDPRSNWHSEGLVGRSGQHVLQYGTANVRFGVWEDDAIRVREYDVANWPPTAVGAETEIHGSVHSPVTLFEETPDQLGAVFFTDHDGGGPNGVKYRSIKPSTWALGPDVFVAPDQSLLTTPVAFPAGDRFAVATLGYQMPMMLGVYGSDGSKLQQQTKQDLPPALADLTRLAVGRTDQRVFVVAASNACTGDMACPVGSIDLYRLDGATSNSTPLALVKTASIPAPISNTYVYSPMLLSDHDRHHFLTWWELTDGKRSSLFAMPIAADGTPAGPIEAWFKTTLVVSTFQLQPSVGKLGVIFPVGLFVPSDGETLREVHVLQRQLAEDAPIEDTLVATTAFTSFSIATVQFDQPRSLIVGYSTYTLLGSGGGAGMMSKYVCSED